jgi:hypothetical protein
MRRWIRQYWAEIAMAIVFLEAVAACVLLALNYYDGDG